MKQGNRCGGAGVFVLLWCASSGLSVLTLQAITEAAEAKLASPFTNVKRKMAMVSFSAIDQVIKYQDVAADDGPVLEATVAAGQSKSIEVSVH